ncbi:MAG: hypothetical protein CW694_02455 [Candidatus Syntrophoarchaeum sp. WYZ-LMO15]|nr:MAG: hypothetical protein CW694_02455 [Candidatus Syntrophoarchaeum sp. WYZ-LMO15]
MLVGAIATNAVPAPVIEPIPIRPVPPPPGEKGIYTTIIPYDNLAKAGETISIEGKVHNDGNSEITVELVPVMREEDEYMYKYSENVINPEWVSVNPGEIDLGAQESVKFDISVSIPPDAKSGYYSGMIAIRTDKYPERIEHYSVQVYKPLEEPITNRISVEEVFFELSKVQKIVEPSREYFARIPRRARRIMELFPELPMG